MSPGIFAGASDFSTSPARRKSRLPGQSPDPDDVVQKIREQKAGEDEARREKEPDEIKTTDDAVEGRESNLAPAPISATPSTAGSDEKASTGSSGGGESGPGGGDGGR